MKMVTSEFCKIFSLILLTKFCVFWCISGSRSPPVRSTSLGDVCPRREPAFPGGEEDPSPGASPPLSPGLPVGDPGTQPILPADTQPFPAGPHASNTPQPNSANTAPAQAYVAECDSIESLGMEENSALLREEEKSKSENSLLIFFDGTDVQDTCV